jgi:hypothetical protein
MKRIVVGTLVACAVIAASACGNNSDTGPGPSGPSGGTQQLRVTYAGFVGQSFSASAPTLCPTAACAVTPTQTVLTEGSYTYPVSAGSTYVIHGTLVGRPAPLGPPATNVSNALSFGLTWTIPPNVPVLGIRKESVRLFLNSVERPNGAIFNGPGCGHYMEALVTPSVTTRWSFIFSVISYVTAQPADLCA